MIQMLRTKENKERATMLAREATRCLNETIRELKQLQKVYERANDFGTINMLARYIGKLEEIREGTETLSGLALFLRELRDALGKK